jgi:hypothetical protein
MARCDTNSYWLHGVKVRSGASEALVDGVWRRVVCDKAEGAEINVQELPDGVAVHLDGFGVLPFDAKRWRGRAGRKIDFEATLETLPVELRMAWAMRVVEHQDSLEALAFISRWSHSPSANLPLALARSRHTWSKLATSAAMNDDDLMMAVSSHPEAIKDPEVLFFLARNASGMQAVRWGASWSLCVQGRADLAVEAALERLGAYNRADEAEIASKLLAFEDVVLAEPSVSDALAATWPSVLLTTLAYGAGVSGPQTATWHTSISDTTDDLTLSPAAADRLLESVKKLTAKQIGNENNQAYLAALVALQRLGAKDAGAILALHGHPLAAGGGSLVKGPVRFVDSSGRGAARRAAFDAWREYVEKLSEGSEKPDAEGWERWAQFGMKAGLPEHVWGAAPFSTTARSRIAAALGEPELRDLVDHSYRSSKALLLARINDDALWRAEMQKDVTRDMCEHMPVALLAEMVTTRPSAMVREVATARGVLAPQEAVLDAERAVQVQAVMKTRDEGVLSLAMSSADAALVRLAARRSRETTVLREALLAWERADDAVAQTLATRLAQVESFDAAVRSLEAGETVVARALLERIKDEDLLTELAGKPVLAKWATQRLVRTQTARMTERKTRH